MPNVNLWLCKPEWLNVNFRPISVLYSCFLIVFLNFFDFLSLCKVFSRFVRFLGGLGISLYFRLEKNIPLATLWKECIECVCSSFRDARAGALHVRNYFTKANSNNSVAYECNQQPTP